MATHDMRALIYRILPKTLKLADSTQRVHLDWFDEEAALTEKQQDELPHGRFRIQWGQEFFFDLEGGAQPPRDGYPQVVETIAAPASDTPTIVGEPDIVPDSMSIEAVVGGVTVTLTPGADFEEVNIAPHYPESLNGFRLLPGAAKQPDPGTDLTVTYKHIMLEITRVSKRDATLRLMLHATRIDPAMPPESPQRAQPDLTEPYEGYDLVDQMGQSLVEYMTGIRGNPLDTAVPPRTPELAIGRTRPVGAIMPALGNSRHRFVVETGIKTHTRFVKETVPRILRHNVIYSIPPP